jgi:hypothetical protein
MAAGTPGQFDDRNIKWQALGDYTGFVISVLHVDEAANSADFIVKFEPDTCSILHRHLADTHTFVIEGDHVIYEMDGEMRESRPVGRYTATRAGEDRHMEGGGPDGCVLLYSVRGTTEALFDLLDQGGASVGTMVTGDLRAVFDMQEGR